VDASGLRTVPGGLTGHVTGRCDIPLSPPVASARHQPKYARFRTAENDFIIIYKL